MKLNYKETDSIWGTNCAGDNQARVLRRIGLFLLVLFNFQLFLFSQTKYTSVHSGAWDDPSTWTGGLGTPGPTDTVLILQGHSVGITTGNGESVHSITVETGGVIDIQNRTFSVGGIFIVNGTLTSDDNSAKDVSFDGNILGGTGTIAINDESRYFDIASDVEVLSTAELHLFGNINIRDGVTVTNKGYLEIYGSLDGDNASGSVWINEANSQITVSGVLMNTGMLNASANGNKVTYIELGNQSVKTPEASTYYDLVISGTDIKTLSGDLTITHDLYIEYGTLDCNDFDLQVMGNWSNEGDFLEGTGTVAFTGTADQIIANVAGEEFYNLTVNNSAGVLILQDDVLVSNILTLAAGIIDGGSSSLTLG